MNDFFNTLKVIFLKHPLLFVLLISMTLTLPWITISDFYTKGEPREATVASYMLNTGNFILPSDYADDVAFKPPFMHWFIAIFSLPQGHVSETTARLPSALGLIGITLLFFAFLYKRKSKTQALIASFIMLTSFEMHRSGIEARVDMFLAFFMIASLISLYKWEEKELKGFPVLIPILLGGAALVKGPVGIILPCLVFGVYLILLQRYSIWKIVTKNLIVAVPALAILLTWYYLAYLQGGEHFLKVVYAENFGRFFGEDAKTLGISYDLGHKGPFWYYLPAILLGFMPWSFLLIFSVFTNSFKSLFKNSREKLSLFFKQSNTQDKITLFSIVCVVVILGFYTIPLSKRSEYVMPAYPFAAYLLTLLYEWAIKFKPRLIKIVTYIIMGLSGLILILTFIFHFVDLMSVVERFIHDAKTLNDIGFFSNAFQHPPIFAVLLWFLLFAVAATCIFVLKNFNANLVLWYTFALFLFLQIFLEGFAYPVFKNGYSIRPFAEKIEEKYNFNENVFVMNDLKDYPNMYELNFYLGDKFKNFDKVLPSKGYFITGSNSIEKIRLKYKGKYDFIELDRTANKFNDFSDVIIVYKIVGKGNN